MLEVTESGEVDFDDLTEKSEKNLPPTTEKSEVHDHLISFRVNDDELETINRRYNNEYQNVLAVHVDHEHSICEKIRFIMLIVIPQDLFPIHCNYTSCGTICHFLKADTKVRKIAENVPVPMQHRYLRQPTLLQF